MKEKELEIKELNNVTGGESKTTTSWCDHCGCFREYEASTKKAFVRVKNILLEQDVAINVCKVCGNEVADTHGNEY